jgi:hypothetical protein
VIRRQEKPDLGLVASQVLDEIVSSRMRAAPSAHLHPDTTFDAIVLYRQARRVLSRIGNKSLHNNIRGLQ